jgi:hypothetical protein
MKPVLKDDVIDRDKFLSQIDAMECTKRSLLASDCKDKSPLGFAYDSGYLACLTELRHIFDVEYPLIEATQSDEEEDE